MAHQKSPGRKTGIFCCAIPLTGAASAFAQALRLSSRGPVAKNAPQERFLYAPADGAPKKSRSKDRDFLLRHPLRGGFGVRASAPPQLAGKSLKTLRRSVFFTRPLMAHQRNALLESRAFFILIDIGRIGTERRSSLFACKPDEYSMLTLRTCLQGGDRIIS